MKFTFEDIPAELLEIAKEWREEDLRVSTLDKAEPVRVRLRRAKEKFESECR
jgi:hypothetical protein